MISENIYPIAATSGGGFIASFLVGYFIKKVILYKELTTNPGLNNQNKAQNLVDFINWAITDGQQFAPDLGYVPLPDQVVQLNQETLRGLTFNGVPLQIS